MKNSDNLRGGGFFDSHCIHEWKK